MLLSFCPIKDELPGNDTLFLIYFSNEQGVLPKIQERLAFNATVRLGSFTVCRSDLTEPLLLGVKQSVNAYNLLRGERLQGAMSGHTFESG